MSTITGAAETAQPSETTDAAPAKRARHLRPKWHGIVYGNGREGTGRESIIGSEAKSAYGLSGSAEPEWAPRNTDADRGRPSMIPRLDQEHLIQSLETLFGGEGACAVCGGTFPEDGPRREGHAEYHRDLLGEYVPLLHTAGNGEQAAMATYLRQMIPTPPDMKKLDRHIRLYGNEGVEETMAAYGIFDLPLIAYKTEEPEGRRATPELRRLIHRMNERGFVTESIAETLNLKLERLKKLLREPAPR